MIRGHHHPPIFSPNFLIIFLFFLIQFQLFLAVSTVDSASPSSSTSFLNPCKRQPFRGRCPPGLNGVQMRSQFVLRYYLRNGECISYPYGHCVNDENEPRLFRYKEECEDACFSKRGEEGAKEATYATIGPIQNKDDSFIINTKTVTDLSTTTLKSSISSEKNDRVKTNCERQRENEGQRIVQGAFIPECTEDGQFRPLQCEQAGGECFCVDEHGIELKFSRSAGGQKPDCESISAAHRQPVFAQQCEGLPELGPCSASVQRWHFDGANCRPFNYSGCGGNGNNFVNEKACMQRCVDQSKCDGGQLALKNSKGELVDCSNANCPPGFLCQANSICCSEAAQEVMPKIEEQIPKKGEAVAGNLISDQKAETKLCDLPKDRGPCDQYQMRFYFNRELDECKYFFYGGCEGNGNNFARVEECEQACINKEKMGIMKQLETTTTTTTRIVASSSRTIAEERLLSATKITIIENDMIDRASSSISPALPSRNIVVSPEIDTKVPQSSLLPENRCQHPKDSGNCAAQFVRWFWNGEAQICETFSYTGCKGNGNNFASREECLSICHREVVETGENVDSPTKNACDSEIDPGQCGGIFMRYGFDRKSRECRQFQYGGCGGNGNNFASLADCRRKCLGEPAGSIIGIEGEQKQTLLLGESTPQTLPPLSSNICEHRMDPGECTGTFQRFSYEQEENRCTKFVYGGCGGNGNNFATLEDCAAACVRVQCPPEPECDLDRCQMVLDGQGCSICSCPPPQHPPLVPNPPAPSRVQCTPLDVQICQEPCIIFLNRRGCRECVCPIMPSPQPNLVDPMPPAPSDSISMPKQSSIPVNSPSPLPLPSPRPSVISLPSPPAPPAPKIILGGVSNNPVEVLPPPTVLPPLSPPTPSPFTQSLNQQTIEPIAFGHNEICSQPLDPGVPACTRYVQRWFFNAESGNCEPFTYTGCAGNRNHFFSKKECQIYCARFSRNKAAEGLPEASTEPSNELGGTQTILTIPQILNKNAQKQNALQKTKSPPPLAPIAPELKGEGLEGRAPMILQTIDPNVRLESKIVPELGGDRELTAARLRQEVEEEEKRQTQRKIEMEEEEKRQIQRKIEAEEEEKRQIQRKIEAEEEEKRQIQRKIEAEEEEEEKRQIQRKIEAEEEEKRQIQRRIEAEEEERLRKLKIEEAEMSRLKFEKEQTKKKIEEEERKIREEMIEEEERKEREKKIKEEEKRKNEKIEKEERRAREEEERRIKEEERRIKEVKEQRERKEMERKKEVIENNNKKNGAAEIGIQGQQRPILKIGAPTEGPSLTSSSTIAATNSTEESMIKSNKTSTELRKETEGNEILTREGRRRQLAIHSIQIGKKNGEELEEEGEEQTISSIGPFSMEEEENTTMTMGEMEGVRTTTEDDRMWVEMKHRDELKKKEEELANLFTNHHLEAKEAEENREMGTEEEEGRQKLDAVVEKGEVSRQMNAVSIGEEGEGITKEEMNGNETINENNQRIILEEETTTTILASTSSPQTLLIISSSSSIPPSLSTRSPPKRPLNLPPIQQISLPFPLTPQQICSLPPDAGPCQQFVPKWFFNAQNGQCQQFSFGSCRGNPNNFPDQIRCEQLCLGGQKPPPPQSSSSSFDSCNLEKDEGQGGGYNVHWYFNGKNLRCEQFVWQGRGGNANRFGTEAECKMACIQNGPETLPRPQNVVPPPNQQQNMEEEENNNNNLVESLPPMVAQGASIIAQTRDREGNVGMPAPAQAIPNEMPPSPQSSQSPMPLPSQVPPSSPPPPPPPLSLSSGSYSAVPLPNWPPKMPENLPPMIGKSPPATIDYVNKIRLDGADSSSPPKIAHGLPNHVDKEGGKILIDNPKDGGIQAFGPKQSQFQISGIPVCPNGLNAMQYSDGRPVLCLPGMGQCPEKSVCFFNGIDFFCCPNEDDPYDQHVFGGYDGEESKHGYKVRAEGNGGLRAARAKRASSNYPTMNSAAGFHNSLRFDDKPPPAPQFQAHFLQSSSLDSSSISASPNDSPCHLPLQKGNCRQAIFRYFYQSDSNQCRPFYFTGCGGNDNNFATMNECKLACKTELNVASPSPLIQRGPCPGGHLPLGGSNPVLCGDLLDSIGCPSGFLCVSGPPSVCCPLENGSTEIRRKPSIPEPRDEQEEVQPAQMSKANGIGGINIIAEMNAQLLLCPDGSDPMRNESNGGGQLVNCGAGMDIDGQEMCQPGFYCSIDPERNARFCCPLQAQGAKLGSGSAEILAPHFGRRQPNPGEVLGKGSLPSDQHRKRKLVRHGGTVGGEEFGHLILRAARIEHKEKKAKEEIGKLMEPKTNQIEGDDPFEGNATSICMQRPDEGRDCGHNRKEGKLRSNLQYFYSPAQRGCKVFFHRGCGGNGNRFETKEECEKKCSGKRR